MSTAQLLNIPQFLGTSYSGYKYYFYEISTTTAKDAYTSSAGSVALANPVTLNSNGSTSTGIWGIGFYRVILKDSNDVTVFDWDNVSGGEASSESSDSGGSSILDPSKNFITNSAFNIWSDISTSATTRTDAQDTADGWYVLTQSGNTTTEKLTSTSNARFNTAMRLTNTHGSAQRMGVCQFTDVVLSPPVIGNTVQGSAYIRTNTSNTIYVALVSGISVNNTSFTKDIVNTWTSVLYTEGNFFISSANIEVISTASITTTANTWTTISTSGSVPNNSTGLYLFIWTGSTAAVSDTLDVSGALISENSSSLSWRPSITGYDYSQLLARKLPAKMLVNYGYTDSSAVSTTTTTLPFDDTAPQNTEGAQFLSLAYTPKSTSNILVISVQALVSFNQDGATGTIALFKDSDASAISANANALSASATQTFTLQHIMTAPSTSEITFKVRLGTSAAGTLTFNGSAGSRVFSTLPKSSIVITEYSP